MSKMDLKQRISEDMKTAMKAKDSQRLGTIRLLMAAIKQREVDERISLDDAQILAVIEKMIKQRHDSISHYQTAGRQELVDQEAFEIDLLQAYLPPALSEAEIQSLISNAIKSLGASSIKDMGKVMAHLKPELQGRADMAKVGAIIKEFLGG